MLHQENVLFGYDLPPHRRILCVLTAAAFVAFTAILPAQERRISTDSNAIPVFDTFRHIGYNTLHALTYNYGVNFLEAGLSTYCLIKNDIDWRYDRFLYDNQALSRLGLPALYIGYCAPLIMPLAFYVNGYIEDDTQAQNAGIALTQSLIISMGMTSIMKGVTGRKSPGIINALDHSRSPQQSDYSGDFAWNFGSRGFIAGWPSAHTANAFSAAAVLSEIYDSTPWVKVVSYSYAVFIGLGVSLCVHWSSEVLAGALIGYAVGKTVGREFSPSHEEEREYEFSLLCTADTIGLRLRM